MDALRPTLAAIMKGCPRPSQTTPKRRDAWLAKAVAAASSIPEPARPFAADQLRKLITRHGYGETVATKLAARVTGLDMKTA